MLSGDDLTPLLSQPIVNVQPGVPVFLQDALAGEGLKIDGFRLASSRGQMKITVELQDPNIRPRVQLYTSDLRRVALTSLAEACRRSSRCTSPASPRICSP